MKGTGVLWATFVAIAIATASGWLVAEDLTCWARGGFAAVCGLSTSHVGFLISASISRTNSKWRRVLFAALAAFGGAVLSTWLVPCFGLALAMLLYLSHSASLNTIGEQIHAGSFFLIETLPPHMLTAAVSAMCCIFLMRNFGSTSSRSAN